jgi:hypothetical protein
MASITHGCRWAVGTAVSIWLGVAGTAQARVFLLEDPYNPGEQVVVEFKGCRSSEARLERLLPLLNGNYLKQRQTADVSPSVRIAMASPPRPVRSSLPLVLGIGY